MSDTSASLRRQIDNAADLQSVVRTMKALAASSIGQYEQSLWSLGDYARSVELGLGACFRASVAMPLPVCRQGRGAAGGLSAIVFGSDQGLVGRFNEMVTDHAVATLAQLPGTHRVWAVGERIHARLADAGLDPIGRFAVPRSVKAITPLIGQILMAGQTGGERDRGDELHLFYNSPTSGAAFESVHQLLLPLDEGWYRSRLKLPWPGKNLPEVFGDGVDILRTLIGEHLFVSVFRACAESLASENASRLAAMERADKNIDELLETLGGRFRQLRQSGIDEELFDVLSGFEAQMQTK